MPVSYTEREKTGEAGVSIYRDIAKRTGGNIYIGVVGPVRTGKSTFIKRFMETTVLPAIRDENTRVRAQDELPQSAGGRTVMTTEPKFIPEDAVELALGEREETRLRVRMIDCVGYLVPGAAGTTEDDQPRMVRTPWSEEPVPFGEAAETGTHRVIAEHATVGVLVTTDGSIGEIPRESYTAAEQRVAGELRALGKPYVIVLNSAHPEREEARALGLRLEETYHAPVALVSCAEMDGEDVRHILGLLLGEFPVREICVRYPGWIASLPAEHKAAVSFSETVRALAGEVHKTGEILSVFSRAEENDDISAARLLSVNAGTGSAVVELVPREGLFYEIASEAAGCGISSDAELLRLLRTFAETKRKYDRVSDALSDVYSKGYGIVMPDISEMQLEEPEIVKQNTGWGVRLKASAPSVHLIRANIETEVSPIVGSEQQSEEMVKFLLHEFEEDPARLWETNMFGKSLHELVGEGIHGKLSHMPEDARMKLGETVERIINEGSGGLICILL